MKHWEGIFEYIQAGHILLIRHQISLLAVTASFILLQMRYIPVTESLEDPNLEKGLWKKRVLNDIDNLSPSFNANVCCNGLIVENNSKL